MFTRYLIRYFRVFMVAIVFLSGMTALSQEKDNDLPEANEKFVSKNYAEAETQYRISNSKFVKNPISSYNLGNAIYKENFASEAKFAFKKAIKNSNTKTEKHNAYHNLGNSFMKEKDYSNAVESYKNALRNNPSDEQTRYNLALAKKMLKEHPPKKDGKKDNKKKDDNNKDKKNNKKDDDNKKNENDKNKDERDKKNDDNGQLKPQPNAISKQRLENLLNAVNHEEKKVQDKMKGEKVKGNPVDNEKDW
jgi:tetratricopeptide (TPR) repeat protein